MDYAQPNEYKVAQERRDQLGAARNASLFPGLSAYENKPKSAMSSSTKENRARLAEARSGVAPKAGPAVSRPKLSTEDNKTRLAESRQKSLAQKAKEMTSPIAKSTALAGQVKSALKKSTQLGSLMKQLDPFTDWIFGVTLSAALLKDILDSTGWDFLGVGQIFTFFCTVIIFFSLFLLGGAGKKKDLAKSIMKRYGTVFIGFLIELVPGISFLPIETCTVILVFVFTLQERQVAQEEQQTALAS